MEKKRCKKCTQTEDRDIALMEKYQEVIESCGVWVGKVSKSALYEKVAESFFITPQEVGRIVRRRLMHKRGVRNRISD